MITIVDYGMGNLGSIANMLDHLDIPCRISRQPEEISTATKLILPGVGAFARGMKQLNELGLIAPLEQQRGRGTPILGICLGMQLMTSHSEEGDVPGLGWLDARTRLLEPPAGYRVPHMGWNVIRPEKAADPLLKDLDDNSRFYFVHSYYVDCLPEAVLMSCHHGQVFTCAFSAGSLYGVQFHPEKSHRYGMRLLQNFYEL